MAEPPLHPRATFPWRDTRLLLRELDERWSFARADGARHFVSRLDPAVTFTPPLVLAIPPGIESAVAYLAAVPERPGQQLVVLLQAGACALGLWEDDELLAHKAIKKYVVRGRGRAQTTHLKTRGKSRYGSRLRLQNAKRLVEEAVAKMHQWRETYGELDLVLYGASTRAWGDLFRLRPAPPFPRDEGCVRIPLDVHVPCFDALRRIRRKLVRGSYTAPSPADEAID